MSEPERRIPLLQVRNLVKHFPVKLGAFGERTAVVRAVDGVSFDIRRGETLGLVGESGCGKSTTGYTVLQLYRPTSGTVEYAGTDLAKLPEKQLRPLRRKIQMVFQDPYSTLNPRMTIGEALAEPIQVHRLLPAKEIPARVASLMEDVGLNPKLVNRYPHEFSGGQRQRICICRALASNPEFVVCDEPISALDVSVQAQIINLLMDLQEKYRLTYLFIAHDLAVVKHISDRVAVMYLGKTMELASKTQLFASPRHPYTRALLAAVPEPDPELARRRQCSILKGDVSNAVDLPTGCRFHPRCERAVPECRVTEPALRELEPGHWVACARLPAPDGAGPVPGAANADPIKAYNDVKGGDGAGPVPGAANAGVNPEVGS